MANSGRINIGTKTRSGITYTMYIDWVSQSTISTNSSKVLATVYLRCDDIKDSHTFTTKPSFDMAESDYWISVNGVKYSYYNHTTVSFFLKDKGQTKTITHIVSNAITHNADGSKTVALKWNIPLYIHDYEEDIMDVFAESGSQNINLGTINRAATITSAPNFTDEDNPTVKYSNPSGSQASSLSVGIADAKDILIIPYKEVSTTGTSYTFNFTDEEREKLRKAASTSTSITVKFYIQTTLNGTLYWNYVSRTLTIKDAAPVITASVKDTNTSTILLTGNANKLVRYYSTAQIEVSAEGQKGAVVDLDTLVIRNGGSSAYSSPAVFENIESNIFTCSIGDSRNAVATKNIEAPMVDYIRLTCNIERSELDTSGALMVDCSGNYFNQSFGNYSNTLLLQCRYKPQDGEYSSWLTMDVSTYENTYSASITVPGLNYREKYVFQCRAIDRLSDATTPEVVVKSLPVFHWSENDFVFEVPVVFNAGATGAEITPGEGGTSSGSNSGIIEGNATIGGDCVINGDLRLKGSGNYGNTLYFGDGSYAMISEPSDDTLTIKATTLNLNGNTVNLNGYPIGYGTWIPTLNNSSAVSSYGVRQGWYSRMGNVITIGWQLKATINSGYSSTSLSISGVPFTPAYAAFGGGVAHNINVSAGFNFEGWTIDTSGSISARMQPCNGTSAGNLQISSSAYYPTGSGNVLTLAGTICYVIN